MALIEQRTYTFMAGKLLSYLPLFETEGLAIQLSHLGDLLGYFTAETGTLNQIVHLWRYETFEDRLRRRSGMLADPKWTNYAAKVNPWITQMESKFLIPTSFSPMR